MMNELVLRKIQSLKSDLEGNILLLEARRLHHPRIQLLFQNQIEVFRFFEQKDLNGLVSKVFENIFPSQLSGLNFPKKHQLIEHVHQVKSGIPKHIFHAFSFLVEHLRRSNKKIK
jgi:hypothetical protein